MNTDNSKEKKCDYSIKRARYFDGEILDKRIFETEQKYHINKRKLLNRILHGWGVVCGLTVVSTNPPSSSITVKPGFALDCRGDEILVCKEQTLDLSQRICSQKTNKDSCIEDTSDLKNAIFYIVIRFYKFDSDPVPSYAPSSDCKEKACDNSMTCEGFCVEVQNTQPPIPTYDTHNCAILTCSTCCPDPHKILLATIKFTGGEVISEKMIKNEPSGLLKEKNIKETMERQLDFNKTMETRVASKEAMEKQLEDWKNEMNNRIESVREDMRTSKDKIDRIEALSAEIEKLKADMANKQDK